MDKGKNKIEMRKAYFRFVRDIPYYIAVGNEQDYSCATKPIMLERLLTLLGLRCQRILCKFAWGSLELPRRILSIPHDEMDTHEFLRVLVPETKKWVNVDPNWDSGIRNPNLPIAEWDGIHSTKIAVPATYTFSKKESDRINAEEDPPKARRAYLKRNRKFFRAVNKWVETQRR